MEFDPNYAVTTFKKVVQTEFWRPDGRVGRKKFWHYFAVVLGIAISVSVVQFILNFIPFIGPLVSLLLSLAMLVLVPPGIGLTVRRMHDIGQPWFFGLIPFYNLYLAAQPGDTGPNAFGEQPLD